MTQLQAYEGRYLPHAISDRFADAQTVAEWLEEIGEPVRATSAMACYHRALTWSGYHVYRNGYVCRANSGCDKGIETLTPADEA